jgi:molybdopterin molybdotransferase
MGNYMIGVSDALSIIKSKISSLSTERISIQEALGCTLAEDVLSPIDMPPFDQSAMDGYALNGIHNSYQVIGEIQAGDSGENIVLQEGEAVRIFTGALVPKSATTVAKQEIVTREGDSIILTEEIEQNINIRPRGEQIHTGQIALSKGTLINPGTAGYLYTLGISEVLVHRKPIVTIIATGNELVEPGYKLQSGQIYESNSYTIAAALETIGVSAKILRVKDDYESTKNTFAEALDHSDLVLSIGGISVGDYDFVEQAFEALGVEKQFYKIRQKPGKPLFFGTQKERVVFGLPGNPASALTCFYMYVIPAIRRMQGFSNIQLEQRELQLVSDFNKSGKLAHFLKGRTEGSEVSVLSAQSSAMLSSFAEADCFIYLNEGQEQWKQGDTVTVFMLP